MAVRPNNNRPNMFDSESRRANKEQAPCAISPFGRPSVVATPTIERTLFRDRASPLGDDANLIIHDLKKTAFDRETPSCRSAFDPHLAFAEKRHERRVAR